MKLSKYTIFHKYNGKNYIFHQISKALLEIENELAITLQSENPCNTIPEPIIKSLQSQGFLIKENTDETYKIRYANIQNRYNSKLLRVTILPTLNCNFRCWYCYEKHKTSIMTEKDSNTALEFIKREAKIKNIETIVLDWFGGEPLLYFYEIIYPLSEKLKEWCAENNVALKNIMTTNGSLINSDMAIKMDKIGLNQLQITLDGDYEYHNKVKFSPTMKDSFNVIVNNIHTLCHVLENPCIELRINYTRANISSTFNILDAFEKDIRKFIIISPHIVWQEIKYSSILAPKAEELQNKALEKGYSIKSQQLSHSCFVCYTENMEQFVINYDLNVYKCTARDYDERFCIGKITDNGIFKPNELYYKYYITESPFMRKECLECQLMPSCLYSQSCLQKKIENFYPKCDKNKIMKSIEDIISYKINFKLTKAR